MSSEPATSAPPLRWGIIGTGSGASRFAKALTAMPSAELIGVASRHEEATLQFGREHEIPLVEAHIADLLAFSEIDAIYLAMPLSAHLEIAQEALRAGKQVLCQKPIGMSVREIELITATARRSNRFLMEALHFRTHPQTKKLIEMIREGAIGTPRVIHAAFSMKTDFDDSHPLFNLRLGGGGIFASGCLPMSFARMVAGVAQDKPYLDPVSMVGYGVRGKTGVDEWASAVALFPGELMAELSCGIRLHRQDRAMVIGDEGTLILTSPWVNDPEGGVTFLEWIRPGKASEVIDIACPEGGLALEAAEVARCHHAQLCESPFVTWDDSTGNAKSLELWLETVPTKAVGRFGRQSGR